MSKKFNRIYVEITNYCNLSCSFCSKDTREKREMTIDEFRDVENLGYKDGDRYRYLHQTNSTVNIYHYEIIGMYKPESGYTYVEFSEIGKNNGPYEFHGTPEELAKENHKGIEFFDNVKAWLKNYL